MSPLNYKIIITLFVTIVNSFYLWYNECKIN